jgi:DNA-binding NarL/FixJ family response regulator
MADVRVFVTDDQQLVRDGIASLLALQEGIEVVGTATNGRECLDAIDSIDPDVVLMDVRMPVMDGIEATHEITHSGSRARVLVLTTFDDEEYIVKSLKAGAQGYLMKDLPIDDLARAIIQTANGTSQLASAAMGILLRGAGAEAPDDPDAGRGSGGGLDPASRTIWNNLSDRERDVLREVGRGATNREIAARLHLSEGTVKNYISNLLAAFDFRDRVEAALTVVRNGWDRRSCD